MTIEDRLIALAIEEDLGDGDHTTLSTIPKDKTGTVRLVAKANGILAGVEVAKKVFFKYDDSLKIEIFKNDGAVINKGDEIFKVSGSVRSILMAERLVLNFMQRMSGIATQTRKYVDLIGDMNTKILDTRKTTPGLRYFEKMAVKIGGGENHRFGLYDMILIKDNHIDFAGGVRQAITNVHNYLKDKGKDLKIEIEVRNFDELKEVLEVGGVDRIMLDNFSVEDTRKAVEMINGRFEIESSGGITMLTIRNYALCGVDYISVGALTHQILSLDLSMVKDF